jgi:anti-sigma-K factor RskA
MNPNHPFLEDIPAYVLGALDADSSNALEAHLQNCETCQSEVASYRAVSANLLLDTPPRQPPAALRRSLQGRLPSAQKAPPPRRIWSFGQIGVGVAFLLLLGLNIYSILQIQLLERQQAQLVRQSQTGQTALAMLTYSDTKTVPISAQGVGGTVVVNKEHNVAVLIIWNLPAIPENQTYQAWLIDQNGNRVGAGAFRPETGQPFTSQTVSSKQGLTNFTGVGITVEPAGGSSQPTGQRIFKIDF